MKRFWSDKAKHHRGYQPYIWKPLTDFVILNLPTSRIGFNSLVKRIFAKYGQGRYFFLRQQYIGEKPHFRPIVYFIIRGDSKYRILKRYTQFKGTIAEPDLWFKQHEKQLRLGIDMDEKLRAKQRNLLKSLEHKVNLQKPFQHTIRSSVSNRPWKIEISAQTRRH